MRILVDENIPRMKVEYLRSIDCDVADIRGTPRKGMADTNLWNMAMAERRLLITTDKGFTEYRSTRHYGILVARLRQPNRLKTHKSVISAKERFSEADWPGLLVMRDTAMSTSPGGRVVEK